MPLHPDIADAVAKVDAASADLQAVLARVREACLHARVYERKGYYANFTHDTIRICADCGLEEHARPHSTCKDFVKLRTEFVADAGESYGKHRVSHDETRPGHCYLGRYEKEE